MGWPRVEVWSKMIGAWQWEPWQSFAFPIVKPISSTGQMVKLYTAVGPFLSLNSGIKLFFLFLCLQ